MEKRMKNDILEQKNIPFFSLIVPVYNQEKYLNSCIDSLLKQTFSSYEIIIVNDGSTDNCAVICEEYKHKTDKIKVIHQKNSGVFCARIKGLKHAKGQYILMIDSDDKLRKDSLKTLYREIDKYNPDVIQFLASIKEDYKTEWFSLPFKNGEIFSGSNKSQIYNILCGSDTLNLVSLKCVKKDIIEIDEFSKYGKGVREGEDLIHSLYICDKAKNIIFIKENLYFYRINNEESRTHTFNDRHYEDIKNVMSIRKMYAEKWDEDGSLIDSYNNFLSNIYYNLILYLITSNISWKKVKSYLQTIFSENYFKDAQIRIKEQKNLKHLLCSLFIKHKLKSGLFCLHLLYKLSRR